MPFSSDTRPLTGRPLAKWLLTAAMLAAPLALTGCSIFGDDEEDVPVYIAKPCPAVGILQDSEKITLFRGASQDAGDVVLRAEIRKAVIKCEYDEDDSVISADVGFDGAAITGPAASGTVQTLPGFLAIIRQGKIIDKQAYDIPVEFSDGASRVRFIKTIEGTKLPWSGRLNGAAYELMVGFQVTPEQLAYNRKAPSGPMK